MLHCVRCDIDLDELEAKIERHYLSNGGVHLTAYCSHCGKFIKNIPHSKPEVLHFGKHKGKPLAVIANEDESYLRWLSNQDNVRESLKSAILEVLEAKNAKQESLL